MQTIDMVSYRDSSPMMGMSMEDSLTSLTSANSFSTINNSSFSGSDLDHAEHYNQEKQKQVQRLAKGQAAHNMRQLPEDYVLSEYDVICGRGRRCFNHIGNQRFRKIVADILPKYSDASAKLEKTIIICDVVNTVRGNSPNGGFVKKDPATGRYFEVGDFLAVRTKWRSRTIQEEIFSCMSPLTFDSSDLLVVRFHDESARKNFASLSRCARGSIQIEHLDQEETSIEGQPRQVIQAAFGSFAECFCDSRIGRR